MTQVLAAEWLFPITAEPIRDAALAIEEGRIAWVGERRDLPSRFLRTPMRAHPRSIILPGWVNAHSHLNLTAALGMLPGSADRFADWIRDLITLRDRWPDDVVRKATVAGMDLLASTGTTTVAQVSTYPDLEPFLEHKMRSVIFHEPLGFRDAAAPALLEEACEWLDAGEALIEDALAEGRVGLGIAPHSPYSVSPTLIRGCWDLARERRIPFSMHLAETHAELEFVAEGRGQLRELLEERGAWDEAWQPPGVSPVRYLADLGVLEPRGRDLRGSAVHCNYLTDDDVALLAQSGLAPVWCPGSHQFFGHTRHPAGRLLAAGASVALGTDSTASNLALNMLREVRLAAERLPEVPREAWLRAATLTAAEALGLGDRIGSLEEGKAADIQVLEAAHEETDPLSTLFQAKLRVRSVLVDGAAIDIK